MTTADVLVLGVWYGLVYGLGYGLGLGVWVMAWFTVWVGVIFAVVVSMPNAGFPFLKASKHPINNLNSLIENHKL